MDFSRSRALLPSMTAIALGLLMMLSPAAQAAPPANDDFANAEVVGPALPVAVPASNVDATAEVGEIGVFSGTAQSTVWFKWTAPGSGVVVVDLCEAGFTGSDSPFERIAVRTSLGQDPPEAEGSECSLRFNATAGIDYYVQVEYGIDQGSFTFRMRNLTPPPNDDFANATVVGPGLPVSLDSTTVDATHETGEPPTLGGSINSRSVWFRWTAPASEPVRIRACDTTNVSGPGNKRIGVYTGNAVNALTDVEPASTYCELDFMASQGTTYSIAFSGYISGELNFKLELFSAPPPANDDFADAATVGPGLPLTVAGNNDFATIETNEPDHSGIGTPRHSVWYKWTPTTNVRVRIAACSRTFSARLGVYTGGGGGITALTQAAEQPSYSPHCRVALNATAGTTYWIAAGGAIFDGEHGPFTLDIHAENLPPNDDFADAQVIGPDLPVTLPGTTVDATLEQNEPSPDPYYGNGGPSVWYRWTAPSDDAIIFSACSAGEPVVLAVFAGSELDQLKHIDNDDQGCPGGGEGGRLAIAPVAGQAYSIMVASANRDFDGQFTLSVVGPKSDPVVEPPVTEPPVTKPTNKFNLKKALKKCRKFGNKKKRARCKKKARKKAALIKCRKKASKSAQAKCKKKVRRKFR